MKNKLFLALSSVLLVAGCSSTVKTYDASGNFIGSCVSQKSWFSTAKASCSGYGNKQGYSFEHVTKQPIQLTESPHKSAVGLAELPAAKQIQLSNK